MLNLRYIHAVLLALHAMPKTDATDFMLYHRLFICLCAMAPWWCACRRGTCPTSSRPPAAPQHHTGHRWPGHRTFRALPDPSETPILLAQAGPFVLTPYSFVRCLQLSTKSAMAWLVMASPPRTLADSETESMG
ncbi:hypothetical protein B0T25DRAFT_198813 [Lasiosphaeria hispida]|uniref:Secreted protein n=1 Tax=Lasiosphaeria hispida TaxID=260671 RepID=A0AAJ0ME05_9PEZI|nr:hypothetical protein B0T25DRAFT_198813 [Lasiosphaeria hispida]